MTAGVLSLSSILGVVPEPTSEWKPEIAPQAMVTKQEGEELPLDDRSASWMNWVTRGI